MPIYNQNWKNGTTYQITGEHIHSISAEAQWLGIKKVGNIPIITHLKQAEEMKMRVQGIDIQKYPSLLRKTHPNIEIVSILDYQKPINYDIVFCNGTLTYLNESTIGQAIEKFKTAKMVIAIHNTTEDDEKAGGTDYRSPHPTKPRLIKSQKWWVNRFKQAGFNAKYDPKTDCFIAQYRQRES